MGVNNTSYPDYVITTCSQAYEAKVRLDEQNKLLAGSNTKMKLAGGTYIYDAFIYKLSPHSNTKSSNGVNKKQEEQKYNHSGFVHIILYHLLVVVVVDTMKGWTIE